MQTGIMLALVCQWSGINAVNFYSITIFEKISNGNFNLINFFSVMDGVVSMIASIISGYESKIFLFIRFGMNHFGRRIVLLLGNGVCMISMIFLVVLYLFSGFLGGE
jgi:hypothetical protein